MAITVGSSKVVRTMCPMNCHPTFCGMLVEVEDGKLKTVSGDKDNPDSQGFLCVRGRSTNEIFGNPSRLLYPQIRDDRRTNTVSPRMEPCWRSCTERHPTRCRYFKSRMESALELCLFREVGAPPLLWVGRQTVCFSDRFKSRMSSFMHGQVSGNCTSWRWSMRAMSSSRPVTASWHSAPGRLVGCCRLTRLPRRAFRRKLIGEAEASPQRAPHTSIMHQSKRCLTSRPFLRP